MACGGNSSCEVLWAHTEGDGPDDTDNALRQQMREGQRVQGAELAVAERDAEIKHLREALRESQEQRRLLASQADATPGSTSGSTPGPDSTCDHTRPD
jgi:hypothetical protein